ncbi:GNAT family N-acetyltransferase [Paenibacillus flagellatus]|nr:GNAT family N-acetyltransferase [Paenibacillus flagellatus]
MHYRRIDPQHDRRRLLELHCEVNYACDTSWARELPYAEYREKWLSTSQTEQFLAHFAETLNDPRTIAEWAEDEEGRPIGYIWVVFADVPDYGLTIAEIADFWVAPECRRQGLGMRLLERIERTATGLGANLLRSETGMDNTASQSLHRKYGFEPYRVAFEKRLGTAAPSAGEERA